MATKVLANTNVEVTDEGYFIDYKQWTPDMANEMAKEPNLTLTPLHFEVLEFLRNRVAQGDALTIRSIGKSNIVDIKGFYGLFPGAPLKLSSKLAGIPKPTSCV
ncbi:MAG: TusE/DsrC/DsvC family sulfur relay protein [Paludibacter sp.]|nr:TusE/DsrC/DsvC family sulfur relay protein [Paludibacter sp.]